MFDCKWKCRGCGFESYYGYDICPMCNDFMGISIVKIQKPSDIREKAILPKYEIRKNS